VTRPSATLLLWSPRVFGVLASIFVGLFALDAFNAGKPFIEALQDFVIHLIPSLVLLAVVVASWHRPWIGGVSFIALAIAYVSIARNHFDWIVVISGPLLVVGTLFLWSWYSQKHSTCRDN
jgi:hypothetical protein